MADKRSVEDQRRMILALARALAAQARPVHTFETHISWVLSNDAHAYKIKKAVQFDFLNFSTLEARHYFCQEELRLNRRLASGLYLDVVPVTGTDDDPHLGESGTPIEYAVKMRAFPQTALWNQRIISGTLTQADIDQLAYLLARFHRDAHVAGTTSRWSSPDLLQKIAAENLDLLQSLVSSFAEKDALRALQDWQDGQNGLLTASFVQRKLGGAVRECHGDLHVANILTLDGRVLVFDCIEFSERLRWIDVMNDVGFTCMDLTVHGQRAFAASLLNTYLESTGDYAGMAVLRYYQTQSALVRWKIALINSQRTVAGADPASAIENRAWAARYMAYAFESIMPAAAAIVIMHGFSGSGKSTAAGRLVELLDAVRIRSDVERKRMRGIAASVTAAAGATALYDRATTDATYARLAMLASQVAQSGTPVIVDATFLLKKQRHQFETLASALGIPYFIVALHADKEVLHARLESRSQQEYEPSDAGVAVLSYQIAVYEALSADELTHAISIDSDTELTDDAIGRACAPIANALAAAREQWKGR